MRAGPYATREAAEKARAQLQKAGLEGRCCPSDDEREHCGVQQLMLHAAADDDRIRLCRPCYRRFVGGGERDESFVREVRL